MSLPTKKDEEGNTKYEYVDRVKRDSICLFASQPEVLSSNIIRYEMADRLRKMAEEGQTVITTPGGYTVEMDFPALELLDKYAGDKGGMAVVSSLTFEIPATQVKNDYGLTVAPYLLMVKSSEKEKFFGENKVPDQITSFYAAYNSETGSYQFNSMRQYFLNLYADYKSGKPIDPEDMRFELVPVGITTEVVEGYTNSTTYVTKCTPFVGRPTMTLLNLSKSLICFYILFSENRLTCCCSAFLRFLRAAAGPQSHAAPNFCSPATPCSIRRRSIRPGCAETEGMIIRIASPT